MAILEQTTERLRDGWSMLSDFVRAARRREVLLAASSLAFYALVSAVPIAIVVLWLASVVVGDEQVQALGRSLRSVAPKDLGADEAVQRISELGTRLGFTALAAALWPASAYGAGLSRALQRIGDEDPDELRGIRGRGLLLVGLFPVIAFGGLAATLAGSALLSAGPVNRGLGLAVGLVFGLAGSAAVSAVAFRLFPTDPPGWPGIARGAAATAGAVGVLSAGYLAYLRFGANFGEHYATSGLAGIVLLAVYLYLFNAVLLVGYAIARGVWREDG